MVLPNSDYQLCDLSGIIPTNRQPASRHSHPLDAVHRNFLASLAMARLGRLAKPLLIHSSRLVDLFKKMSAIVGFHLDDTSEHLYP